MQNQHDLRELAGGLRQTPFWKAIASDSCVGAVQVVDNKCTPPKRIWCVLEVLHYLFFDCVVLAHSVLDSMVVGTSASTVASSSNILRHTMKYNFVCETEILQLSDLHCVLCQINIVVEVANKDFEVLAMIEEGTEKYGDDAVPPGPALRDAKGAEHIKSAQEGKGGFFPCKVAKAGALVRVQDAEASWANDKTAILNHIVESADPNSEPPTEHAGYDKMNREVQGLFRGAAMYSHAMQGRTEKMRDLLSEGTEGITYQSPGGETPAYTSANYGQMECLQLLAESKADLNQPQNRGRTPAFASAWEGQTECLRLLADRKADLNQPTMNGRTPAFVAAQSGHTECLQLLAECKADLDQPNRYGATPAWMAAQDGYTECLQLLADQKADLSQPDNNGATPAFVSAQEGHTECLQLLADHKADLHQATPWGDTLLSTAKSSGHSAIVQILLAAGVADLNQAERHAAALQRCGQTPVGTVVPFGEWCTHGAPDASATSGKVCYEAKLLTLVGYPQFGWASSAFTCISGETGAGDDGASWAVDGVRGQLFHNGERDWRRTTVSQWFHNVIPRWVAGDVIGIAADVDKGDIWCAHNGNWSIAFQNADLAGGVFPVVTCSNALVSINLGKQPLQHPPPSECFVTVSTQTESPTLVLMT